MKNWLLIVSLIAPSLASARVPDWWRKVGFSDADSPAQLRSDAIAEARLATRGPIKLRLAALSGDIEVIAGVDRQISVKLSEGDGARVSFREEGGDRVELLFDGMPALRCGRLCVEVPAKSAVELSSDSGDVAVRDVNGSVRVRATAGDVLVKQAERVDLRAITGDILVSDVSGEVRVETVTGDIHVASAGDGAKLHAATTSGDVFWRGHCGSACRLEARTLSGDIHLQMGTKSSFGLRFMSHGGEISDELNLNFAGPKPPREANLRGRYGSGDGWVEAETYSGDLHLARAR